MLNVDDVYVCHFIVLEESLCKINFHSTMGNSLNPEATKLYQFKTALGFTHIYTISQ